MANRKQKTDSATSSSDAGTTTAAVVGIGASAGGLAALQQLLGNVPSHSGLAWVIVVHLPPDLESHLPELLQPYTNLAVTQVSETIAIEPDHVYVIPPGSNLEAIDSHLRLAGMKQHQQRRPIDHFFSTIADTYDGSAIGVVLTGTGTDGAIGIRSIKEGGGLAIAQDPVEAEYDGMPQSAIATGVVDLVLPLASIPDAVIRFAHTRPRVRVPSEEEELKGADKRLLLQALENVRMVTGRDFTRYKHSTVLRRIQRRMQIRQIELLEKYVQQLRDNADEVRALADDMLITVTEFFRDRDVWETIAKKVIPELFQNCSSTDTLRFWSVGCSTGEEVYSLTMLLLEEAARQDTAPRLQIFASDLDARAIDRAREGFYPADIEASVGSERLHRFFDKSDGGFRIRKPVRELIVFAPHNLLRDPPFSRMNLIICRNLLIYLQRDVQRDVMTLFHYALLPDGVLVLGSAEVIDAPELFRVQHKKACIYRKRNIAAQHPRILPTGHMRAMTQPRGHELSDSPTPYGGLHQQLVEQYAPPSMLLDPNYRVVHLSEHAGRYLVHPGGELTSSAVKLVREEIRMELHRALHTVRQANKAVRTRPIGLTIDGQQRYVVLDVRTAHEPAHEAFTLIVFHEWDTTTAAASESTDSIHPQVAEVQAELHHTKEQLQTIIEEYETSQEEMKASHEELQSANEELRSTLEELETSKEELQSMNEELQTVNQENRHKVEELAKLTSDLQNLLVATELATLFLDRDLRIVRFTPLVAELFNIRTLDRGRPLTDITHKLGYKELTSDAQQVLRNLTPIEREVREEGGRWFLLRIVPYRSTHDRIEGVVITFFDITGPKEAEELERARRNELELRLSNQAAHLERHAKSPEQRGDDDMQLEQELMETRMLVSNAAEETSVGWVWWDFSDDSMSWDARARDIMGLTTQNGTFANAFLTTVPAPHRDRALERIVASLDEQRPFFIELPVETQSEPRFVHFAGAFTFDANGKPLRGTGLVTDITERRRSNQQRDDVLRQLSGAAEEERRHLSRELHDQMGQLVTGLTLELRSLRRATNDTIVQQRVPEIEQLAQRIAREIQTLARELRPPALDTLGLTAALREHLDSWSERTGIPTDFHTVGVTNGRVQPHIEMTLYRVVQEALTNILKHANASRVSVLLERRNGTVSVIIEDNGRGFDPAASLASDESAHQLGLRGMKERLALLNGSLDIETTPDTGTTLYARVPERTDGGSPES